MGRRFRRMRQEVVKVVRKMFLKCCCCGRLTGQYRVETFSLQKILSHGFCCSDRRDVTECERCSDNGHRSPVTFPEVINDTDSDASVSSSDKSSQGKQPLLVDYAANDFCHDVYPNSWSVKKTISCGEFGKTELVTFPNYQRKYVLKTSGPDKSEQDVSMLLQCQSNFVRKLYACFSMNNQRYVVLDHCPFGNLNRLTKHGNALDEHAAAWTSANIYAAADHIHSLGILNLKIKPSSVLINTQGRPVLSDFGNARRYIGSDTTNLVAVTSAYTCPEVLRGQQPNKMTDFWAIACCCYQMLKRRSPFLGKTTAETQTKICLGLKVESYGLSCAASRFFTEEFDINPDRRLGSNGISIIMAHRFFNGINWEEIRNGRNSEQSPLLDLVSYLHKNRSCRFSLQLGLPLSDSDSSSENERSRRQERRHRNRPKNCPKKRPRLARKDNHSHRAAVSGDDGYKADMGELVDDT